MTPHVASALALISYYSGRGVDVDLTALSPEDQVRTPLTLALIARRCLGRTEVEQREELGRLSLYLQTSDAHAGQPEVEAALTVLAAATSEDSDRDREAGRMLRSLPTDLLEPTSRHLAWLAHGLMGDDARERGKALAHLSLMMQLVALDEPSPL